MKFFVKTFFFLILNPSPAEKDLKTTIFYPSQQEKGQGVEGLKHKKLSEYQNHKVSE